MNDKVILGTVVMLVSLNTALPALASQQDDARNAAEVAVINQEVVDAQVLRSHGDEYTREFLLQFHNATQKYRQAFQLGIADQEEGRTHAFGDHVEQAAYQRGIEKAKAQTQEKTGAKENTFSDQLVDQKRYLPKQPLPNKHALLIRLLMMHDKLVKIMIYTHPLSLPKQHQRAIGERAILVQHRTIIYLV